MAATVQDEMVTANDHRGLISTSLKEDQTDYDGIGPPCAAQIGFLQTTDHVYGLDYRAVLLDYT